MSALGSALGRIAEAERAFPHAREAGVPVIALAKRCDRNELAALDHLIGQIQERRRATNRLEDLAVIDSFMTTATREVKWAENGAIADMTARASAVLEQTEHVPGEQPARPARAMPRPVATDAELGAIVTGGAEARRILEHGIGMVRADVLIAGAPRLAVRLAELVARVPYEDRWVRQTAWHRSTQRMPIIGALCQHVETCAASRTTPIVESEVAHAIGIVAEKVIDARVAADVAAIRARADAEIAEARSRVRRELGL